MLRLRIASALVGFCYLTSLAQAHAILVTAEPAAGQLVHGPDLAVNLRFNSRVDAKRSMLTLVQVPPAGDPQTLPISSQSSPETLNSSAHGLKSGSYVLRWQVLAVDGHISRGEVPFRVQ
jgi:methionine-rich copper-binding protein CopC